MKQNLLYISDSCGSTHGPEHGHATGTFYLTFCFPEMKEGKNGKSQNGEEPERWRWGYSRERDGRAGCNCSGRLRRDFQM